MHRDPLIEMLIDNFNNTIDIWQKSLEGYDYRQLTAKPCITGWSIGQVYMHLLEDTSYYLEQIHVCISNNDHATEGATLAGKVMLLNSEFPNEILEGAPSNAFIRQPESKEQLITDLSTLKSDMNLTAIKISESLFSGKTQHPGLGYFSAPEWLQFADMHFRHHLRQKKRIDDFLERE